MRSAPIKLWDNEFNELLKKRSPSWKALHSSSVWVETWRFAFLQISFVPAVSRSLLCYCSPTTCHTVMTKRKRKAIFQLTDNTRLIIPSSWQQRSVTGYEARAISWNTNRTFLTGSLLRLSLGGKDGSQGKKRSGKVHGGGQQITK